MRISIYALTDVFYYSYYIEGLYRLFGKRNVNFSLKNFPAFPERTFAAIIEFGGTETKIAIDAFDSSRISKELLDWCDVYGKINYNENVSLAFNTEKIVAIGPSFGIRIWSFPESVFYSFLNYLKGRKRIYFRKTFFANYWSQYKRRSLSDYNRNKEPSDDKVYFISSLWKKEGRTNKARANFIKACLELKHLKFEGGFAPRRDMLGFETFKAPRIGVKEYLDKLKDSALTFNTPAVENCHGWKLPEFLALGKAIVSTEHKNQLLMPLIHGIHIHYTGDTKEDIKLAVEEVSKKKDYRQVLERNARLYFENYLLPEAVISNLLRKAAENK